MEILTQFLGRFHPLVVHLPIGFLLLALVFECLSFLKNYRKLRVAVQPSLVFGAAFAIVACITGYFLRQEGGYDEDIIDLHQNLGIATAVVAIVVLWARKKIKQITLDPNTRKKLKALLFIPLIFLLGLTGHWGGSLTHGEDYLSFVGIVSEEETDPTSKIKAIANLDSVVLYQHVIQPLLEARCYSCHSAKKQKGELRLDSPELIARGGKNGLIISSGIPDSSELFKRLVLPLEDKHHMPPNEKTQLSSAEITLIQLWIEEGASFEKAVYAFRDSIRVTRYLKAFKEGSNQEVLIPEADIKEPNDDAILALRKAGVLVIPVSSSSNYVMINFANTKIVTDDMFKWLDKIKANVVWMNLGFTSVADNHLKMMAQFKNLFVLYLNNTGVTDSGIVHLENLKTLKYLNLVGTSTTDQTLKIFEQMTGLKKVYVYQTKMTSGAIKSYLQKSKVVVDTGNYQLQKLPGDTVVYKRKI